MRILAGAWLIYGTATLAHGSGFLAVFIAGILVGDAAPRTRARSNGSTPSLASLAEIVAFVVLGLTVALHDLAARRRLAGRPGLAVLLTFVVRPLLVGLLLLPVRLRPGSGCSSCGPGSRAPCRSCSAPTSSPPACPARPRLYGVVLVVVAFSVVVQGGLVPYVARRCGVPMRTVEPEPWALGVRFRARARRHAPLPVAAGAPADGCTLADLALGEDAWISLISRDGQLVPVQGDTVLHAGDEVLVLADPERTPDLTPVFTGKQGPHDADPRVS